MLVRRRHVVARWVCQLVVGWASAACSAATTRPATRAGSSLGVKKLRPGMVTMPDPRVGLQGASLLVGDPAVAGLAVHDPGRYRRRAQPGGNGSVPVEVVQIAVNAAAHELRIVLLQLRDEHGESVRRQRAALHREPHHPPHRRERQPPEHPGEPIHDPDDHRLVPARERGCQQHNRSGERTGTHHLQGDVGPPAVSHHGRAAELSASSAVSRA